MGAAQSTDGEKKNAAIGAAAPALPMKGPNVEKIAPGEVVVNKGPQTLMGGRRKTHRNRKASRKANRMMNRKNRKTNRRCGY